MYRNKNNVGLLLAILVMLTSFLLGAAQESSTIPDEHAIGDYPNDIEKYKQRKQNRPNTFQDMFRIVGGQKTSIEEHPFIVSLQHIEFSHICGGSLLNELWVLSASHCVISAVCDGATCSGTVLNDPREYLIVAGATDVRPLEYGQIREVKMFVKHPRFNQALYRNDIALIQVKNPFEFTKSVRPVVLPTASILNGTDVSDVFKECIALGWGSRRPRSDKPEEELSEQEKLDMEDVKTAPNLMKVSLPVISLKFCKYLLKEEYITNTNLCTMYTEGGKDACQGDSGGPLICGHMQYGITSWGYGCASPNEPGVFTKTDTYNDWIVNILSGGPNIDYLNASNKLRLSITNWIIIIIITYW